MCQETTYRFESKDCGCVYVYVVACEEARVPIDAMGTVSGARARWPVCCARKGVRKADGGSLGEGCWVLREGGKEKCEKRLVDLVKRRWKPD